MANNIFSDLINRKICLERQNNSWIWKEKGKEGNTRICFFPPNDGTNNSIAFSLDKLGNPQKIWPFFVANPPSGIGKMCDVIILAKIQSVFNAFVIEIKESKYSRQDDAIKQIKNGEIFCKWLINLLCEYECIDNNCKIVRIYCSLPRRQRGRNPTSGKGTKSPYPIKNKKLLEYRNQRSIYLNEAIGFAKSKKVLINYMPSND